MNWFNIYGAIILVIMLIPNIIDAKRHPEHFNNLYHNKLLEILEQVGRFESFSMMLIHIPGLCFGFWSSHGKAVYLIVNGVLLTVYISGWVILQNKMPVFRAYLLSVTPSMIFLFSGIMLMNVPLILFSILFAAGHIIISVRNAKI